MHLTLACFDHIHTHIIMMNLQLHDFECKKYCFIVERFQALLKLEVSPAYDRHERGKTYDSSPMSGGFTSPALWRENFVGRCYTMVDLPEFSFSRETVEIAMSYLDSYIDRKGGDIFGVNDSNATAEAEPMIKLELLIASSACLFIAIKLNEPNHHFDIPTLVRINNGHFARQDIVDAEKDILKVLDFRMSPPTVMSFVRLYLSFLEGCGSPIDKEAPLSEEEINYVIGFAKLLSELSLYDRFFVDKDASKIAFACVLTAFEGMSRDNFPQAYMQRVADCVLKEGKLDYRDECVHRCRVQLRITFEACRTIRRNPKVS